MSDFKKTVLITDIHGCLFELKMPLEKCKLHADEDRLICLGDLIDHGPDSYGVYRFMRGLKEKMGNRCILVMGNHDSMLIEHDEDSLMCDFWMRRGGAATVRSFEENGSDILDCLDWFWEMVPYYETENYICSITISCRHQIARWRRRSNRKDIGMKIKHIVISLFLFAAIATEMIKFSCIIPANAVALV